MQKHYVHSVRPKKLDSSEPNLKKGRRVAVIFRHGDPKLVEPNKDKSTPVESHEGNKTLSSEERDPFGALSHLIEEGHTYGRTYLLDNHALSNVQGGVGGTKSHGCSSIVVSRLSAKQNEEDSFDTLHYTSNGKQRGGALFKSWKTRNPVRVFRTSDLSNSYTVCRDGQIIADKTQSYRYDGLYEVTDCFLVDGKGKRTAPVFGPVGDIEYTFRLERVSTKLGNSLDSAEFQQKARNELGTMLKEAAASKSKRARTSQD